MFDADRPITSVQQDRLGRSTFAKYLARCILDHKASESLVIGLYGTPGSGKTSLINLVLEELRYAASNMFDNEKPIILNFSPWSYSGQGQLIYGFYRRLSSELRQAPFLENSTEIIHLLELYMSFFTHTPVPKSMRVKRRLIAKLKKPVVNKQEEYAWESGRDPIQVKTELNNYLKQLKHKIIIIIDNISRLTPPEINQILQIVKSMGDYANTVYLLSFNKEQVINAINKTRDGEGAEFLEKLVQLPFEVPPINKNDLESLLFDRLEPVLAITPEDTWDMAYWADIYYATLKYFFNSCRDITRYVNSLSFGYSRVRDVVNPVDYFALTALEVFAPVIFAGIRENKDLFTDLLDNVYVLNQEQIKQDKARIDEILNRNISIPKDILQNLLIAMFPRLHQIYLPNEQFYHSEARARELRRICSPDMFDVYFRLSIPNSYMPESELQTILSQASDAASFDQALTRLNQDDRVTRFLDLLDGNVIHRIAKKYIANVIKALMDDGDLFPEGKNTRLSFNTAMRVHRICHQLLHELPSTEKRFEVLQEAINNASKSLYIMIHEIDVLGRQHLEGDDEYLPIEHREITPVQLLQLQELIVTKIEDWARSERLTEHPKFVPILFAWKKWGDEEVCRSYIKTIIQTDRGLLNFLCSALKEPVKEAMDKQEKNPEWREYLANITAFVELDDITNRAKAVFEGDDFEKLRETEQLAILIFLDLIGANTFKVIPKTTV
ncbi:MAG: P-loop NTPase fold protein [Pseudomonadota bacterium]